MLTRLAVFLTKVSPALRRRLWRRWYTRLAGSVDTGEWTFMNYGVALPREAQPELAAADEAHRLSIQLYHHTVRPADLRGATVLEVGSGRGGGASYLARYLHPAQVVGADFSPAAVELSSRVHRQVRNLAFVTADAEKLPMPDASFDAVVNVESSHCYGRMEQFLAEAARVLRPGGWFLFADIRPAETLGRLREQITAVSAWRQVEDEDLTPLVVAALRADNGRKRRFIAERVPAGMRDTVGGFSALVGSPMFVRFEQRRLLYHRFACRKA